jgi:hypothetical protein
MSLDFDGYGSLEPDAQDQSILGPLMEPISSLDRHYPFADTGQRASRSPPTLPWSLENYNG